MYADAAVLVVADASAPLQNRFLTPAKEKNQFHKVPWMRAKALKELNIDESWEAVKKWVFAKRFLEVWCRHLSDEKQNIFQFLSPVLLNRG